MQQLSSLSLYKSRKYLPNKRVKSKKLFGKRRDMALKKPSKNVIIWLVMISSIVLNLFFVVKTSYDAKKEMSWSEEAAEEAEAVAAIGCSGHGRAYMDGLMVVGDEGEAHQACECNSCYGGSDCSVFLPRGCDAEADGGDPYFLEPFWMQHAASSAVLIAGWHRMSYTYHDLSFTSALLETRIRKVHSLIGNAVTDGRYIVFGVGSTQLLNAAVHALSPHNSSGPPAKVFAAIPYYPLYQVQTEYLSSVDYEFEGDPSLWKNSSDTNENIIEFVTSPNNPNGLLNKPLINASYAKTIYDHAYYWPHFTPISAPADKDVMIFTISKLTGHAGSRFGWALIKDRAVYEKMYFYTTVNSMGVSRESQVRAVKLLDVVLKSEGRDIFEFGYETMKKRWERLRKVLSPSKRLSLQQINPQHCTFLRHARDPTPAYAWLRCEREEDTDCFQVLKGAGINGREGTFFGAQARYVRLSVIRSQDDFDLLLHRLKELVSNEEVGAKSM